ncbi:MAG: ATP-binding cassette domain-containing protein [Bacteroidetes bacterium]|nr:ATP-binding cassette domain-containing protein [Bacteroidota bacterium]
MISLQHQGIYLTQASDSNTLIESLLAGKILLPGLDLPSLQPAVFSDRSLKLFLEEEFLHGGAAIESEYRRPLHHMSSGEQKRALLNQLIFQKADFFLLDELYDHIDIAGQAAICETVCLIAQTKPVIQLLHRRKDALPFLNRWMVFDKNQLIEFESQDRWNQWLNEREEKGNQLPLPQPIKPYPPLQGNLVEMKGVSVSYDEKPIVQNIEWTIQQGEFWQLVGPNGSGKSTLLSLISGDNPKGYGQELYLFGRKKGSGETVWDVKKNIGYFNSSIILHFSRLDSIEKMIVSGFNDSIGLYIVPSDQQLRLAGEWLHFLGLYELRNKPIQFLPQAQQRMVLIARAMVKHPPLLILDEPTASLDDAGAALIIGMIQQIARESSSAILYVSHSKEEGLDPSFILNLIPSESGSISTIEVR